MRRLLFFIIIVQSLTAFSQSSAYFNYQAVIRNVDGNLLKDKSVDLTISILHNNSVDGAILYKESHSVKTSSYGLIQLKIGNGRPSRGTFSSIEWGKGSFYIKLEIDINRSGIFDEVSTTQLLSVPFSMFSEEAANGIGYGTDESCSNVNEGKMRYNPLHKGMQFCDGEKWQNLTKAKPLAIPELQIDMVCGSSFSITSNEGAITVYDNISLSNPLFSGSAFSGSFSQFQNNTLYVTVTIDGQVSPAKIIDLSEPCICSVELPSSLHQTPTSQTVFYPTLISGCDAITDYKLEIYDQTDNLLFETTDFNAVWDGTNSSGALFADDMAIWKVRYVGVNGYSFKDSGVLNIIK